MDSVSSEEPGRRPDTCKECIGAMQMTNSKINGPVIAGSVKRDVFYCQHYHQAPVQQAAEADLDALWETIKPGLKARHRKLQIPKMPWLGDWELRFKDCFINPSITTKLKGEKRIIQLQDIFKSKEGRISCRILLEGPAGYGKTTILRKLCYDYGMGDESYIQHFEVVILLELRELDGSLDNMITQILQVDGYSEKNILDSINRYQRKVLILLDGFDELHQGKYKEVLPLLTSKQLPEATIIVTSRHGRISLRSFYDESNLTELRHCADARLFITGLNAENRVKFLELYLKGDCEQKLSSIRNLIEGRLRISLQEEGISLFECPLFLLLLVILSENADLHSVKTITDLYKCLFNFILKRTTVQNDHSEQHLDFFEFNLDDPPAHVNMLNIFGAFAMKELAKGQFVFTEEEILDNCNDNRSILELGLFIPNDMKCGVKRKTRLEPVHLTVLEFCAAYHLWMMVLSATPIKFFFWILFLVLKDCSKLGFQRKQSLIFTFLTGLCKKQSRLYFYSLKLYYFSDKFFGAYSLLYFSIFFIYACTFTFLCLWYSSSMRIEECINMPLPMFSDACKCFYHWLCAIFHS